MSEAVRAQVLQARRHLVDALHAVHGDRPDEAWAHLETAIHNLQYAQALLRGDLR